MFFGVLCSTCLFLTFRSDLYKCILYMLFLAWSMALQALDSCVDSCDPGEFHLGFGTDLAFQSAKENLNPPDSRKRIVQNDKDQPCVEETFVQPDPPKKHKGSHSTQVSVFTDGNLSIVTCPTIWRPKYAIYL